MLNRPDTPLVLHIITDLDDGGAEGVLFRLCLAAPKGGAVVVSLSGPGKYSELLRQAGVEVAHLDMPPGRVTLAGLRRLWMATRQMRPDTVQTWMYHSDLVGGIIARLAGCRNVVWNVRHTNLDSASLSGSTRFVARACSLVSHLVPQRIVACAESTRTAHVAFGYAANKFVIIPNGYDIVQFQPCSTTRIRVRQELGLPNEVPAIGLVGRWNPQKDHRNLITALSNLEPRPFELILIGTGCDKSNSELTSLLDKAGLSGRTHLLGRRSDVPALMNAIDLHVLSSYSEAFPNVVAEAMASGTPCVVTDVGDAANIVGETGWVVPSKDPVTLSGAIADALDEHADHSRWASRQARARSRIIENFSLHKMVASYEAVWDEVAEARKR